MSNITVEILSYDELSEDEKDFQPNNGSGKEYANYLKICGAADHPLLYSDAMEPEDAKFTRDLNWISGLLTKMYNAGWYDKAASG